MDATRAVCARIRHTAVQYPSASDPRRFEKDADPDIAAFRAEWAPETQSVSGRAAQGRVCSDAAGTEVCRTGRRTLPVGTGTSRRANGGPQVLTETATT